MHRPWYKVPLFAAIPKLIEIRNELRQKNLHDTEDEPLTGNLPPAGPGAPQLTQRTADGTYNDLKFPRMGCAGARFGRNVPLEFTYPDEANLLNPSPRLVSRELMTRDQFQPVPFLNLLAAAWIQFETHDWFSHGRDDSPANPRIDIPLDAADPWPEHPMRVPRTPADPTRKPGSTRPPAFQNHVTHWWDGSQIYGSDAATAAKLRTGRDGKIKAGADGKLPLDPDTGLDLTGFIDNSWIGMSMLHALFALEHNSICDMLQKEHPDWSDDLLYAKARLINAALTAKIHTVEWTPSIMPHHTVKVAMRTNWYGFLGEFGEKLQKLFPGLNDSELIGGIIGSPTDHHTAPYAMTEEFVTVYRMHALIPDDFEFRSAVNHQLLSQWTLPEISGRAARKVFDTLSMTDLFYSFGMMHPGMIRLHNFPKHLQNLKRDDGMIFDLAAVDVLRDRERGVPRYNRFRELLHMEPVKSFDEITDNPVWAEQIRRVYNNDINLVDTQVGLMCEPLPDHFGFSETAFRVFILMASRRLKSDRFFTAGWKPEVYTDAGIAWVENNNMSSVLLRHFPQLGDALAGLDSAFRPWNQARK
jgi:hypothetical protein